MRDINLPHIHNTDNKSAQEINKHISDGAFMKASQLFKVLSDSSRLTIYWLLCHCEECVVNISAISGLSGPAVCHHLKILRENDLVICHRVGKEVYYKATPDETGALLHRMIENVITIACPVSEIQEEKCNKSAKEKYTDEQIRLIKEIHNYLVLNLDKKITIDDLSKKFLINTTSLKGIFKSVWGTSVATHIKEHRMKKACELLINTDMSIAQVGEAVGYKSPAKFTAAFKAYYTKTPKDYKKTDK